MQRPQTGTTSHKNIPPCLSETSKLSPPMPQPVDAPDDQKWTTSSLSPCVGSWSCMIQLCRRERRRGVIPTGAVPMGSRGAAALCLCMQSYAHCGPTVDPSRLTNVEIITITLLLLLLLLLQWAVMEGSLLDLHSENQCHTVNIQ